MKKTGKKKSSVPVRVLKMIAAALGLAVLVFALLILVLTATEWKPADREELAVIAGGNAADREEPAVIAGGNAAESGAETDPETGEAEAKETFRIMSWNVGYGALGDNADFFMDGGKMVQTADKARVEDNLAAIISHIEDERPDFAFLQEADENSTRSRHINEVERIGSTCAQAYTFAMNYKALVPYPVPPLGKVKSGLLTLSNYGIEDAERVQLPIPFKWPIRIANLKRCVSINHVTIPGTEQKLALVNLHLEAYDSGEGKKLQTEMLRDLLEAEYAAGNYVIAGGDFNQLFSSYAEEALTNYPVYENRWQPGLIETDAFDGKWTFLMDPSAPSCRSLDQPYAGADPDHFQYYLIDGFIVSDNVEVASVETQDLNFEATDHNPVVMEFRLRRK